MIGNKNLFSLYLPSNNCHTISVQEPFNSSKALFSLFLSFLQVSKEVDTDLLSFPSAGKESLESL